MSASKLLLVDDDRHLLVQLRDAAEKSGYEVDTATDGDLAWEKLESDKYDLLVTDLCMKRMGGHELMERLDRFKSPPAVIVVTGYATIDDAVKCLKRGAKDFLRKPFGQEEFTSSLKKALSGEPKLTVKEPDWDVVANHYTLSPAQLRVVKELYLTGKPTTEVAEILCLSTHTVRAHLRAIYAKVGVEHRAGLIREIQLLA